MEIVLKTVQIDDDTLFVKMDDLEKIIDMSDNIDLVRKSIDELLIIYNSIFSDANDEIIQNSFRISELEKEIYELKEKIIKK